MNVATKLELTLAILKPDVVAQPHVLQNIHRVILQKQFYFIKSKSLTLSSRRATEFYKEHEGKFFLSRLVSFMSRVANLCFSGPVWTHILARENAIAEWRKLMGPTKVLKTVHEAPDTIRGMYGLTDTRNCTHGSDSTETAAREIKFFFPEFDPETWFRTEGKFFQDGQVMFDEDFIQHLVQKNLSDSIS